MFLRGGGCIGGLGVELLRADVALAEDCERDAFDTETHVKCFDMATEEIPEMARIAAGAAEVDAGDSEVAALGTVAGELNIEGAHAAVFVEKLGCELIEEIARCMFDGVDAGSGASEIDEEIERRFGADGTDEIECITKSLIEAPGQEWTETRGKSRTWDFQEVMYVFNAECGERGDEGRIDAKCGDGEGREK